MSNNICLAYIFNSEIIISVFMYLDEKHTLIQFITFNFLIQMHNSNADK